MQAMLRLQGYFSFFHSKHLFFLRADSSLAIRLMVISPRAAAVVELPLLPVIRMLVVIEPSMLMRVRVS